MAHSLHLCISKAAQMLPSCLDFLCTEVYNWFSKSPLRKLEYKQIFDLIDTNENKKMHKFIQFSQTRWLARANVIKIILE